MSTFSEIITPVLGSHGGATLQLLLEQLGSEVKTELDQLDRSRRAALVDRLMRNLRAVSVSGVPKLERELLKATDAEPRGTLRWSLNSATALVELRSGIKYVGTWLGYEWAELCRLQAVIGGLARWVNSSGTGTLTATVEGAQVNFEIELQVPGFDGKTVETSALVMGVRDMVADFQAHHAGDNISLKFALVQR